jgi:hypothetical protein
MTKILATVTGSISFSQKGDKGDSGDTPYVIKTVVDYAITSSVSEAKKWSSTAPDASAAANKGKFLWTRTTYTWSNNKTTENITYTYIGKDGKDGASVAIKGSKDSTSQLPTSGNTLGDGYIIDGYLWVYTGTSKTDSTHAKGFERVSKFQGDPGASATQYYIHTAWMKDSKGTGFTTTSNGGQFDYFGVLVDTNPDAPSAAGDWTKYDWSYVKGATGATGNGIKSTEVTYQIGSSGTTPPKDGDGVWDTKVPNITDEKPYLWTRTIFVYTNGTRSDPSYSVATRGTKGALMREHDGFESGSYKYLSGSGAEAYVDVVCINRKWYQCTKTYTSSSPSVTDGHWSLMNNYTSIATQLLLAENATIDMLGSNQINLYNPTGGAMFGSFRVVDDDNDYALWLGGKDGKSASFAVTRGGAIKATAGTIGSFTIRELQGGYYDFFANYRGVADFSAPSSISLNSQGILASTGSPGNGARFFFGNSEFTNDAPSWGNGALQVSLSFQYGADTSQTAANISVMGKSSSTATALQLSATGGLNNHAIAIRDGDVAGLRPSFVRITSNYTLTEYNHTVACDNTSAITLTLPSSPKLGQCYTVIQQGGRVTLSANISIYDSRNFKTATTWYSDTRGQVSWIWYNGGQWIVCFSTN